MYPDVATQRAVKDRKSNKVEFIRRYVFHSAFHFSFASQIKAHGFFSVQQRNFTVLLRATKTASETL